MELPIRNIGSSQEVSFVKCLWQRLIVLPAWRMGIVFGWILLTEPGVITVVQIDVVWALREVIYHIGVCN